MTTKLQIQLFDEYNISKRKIVCGHLDSTKNITILSDAEPFSSQNPGTSYTDVIIPEKVDHFNISEGMTTIYYKSGHYLEIRRINE
jgi:hypothetical protein